MENLLSSVAALLSDLWNWTVHLNGGLQVALILLACVASGACAIVSRRAQNPSMAETGSSAARMVIVIACYVLGVVFAIVTVFALAAVFAPLVGFAE